MTKTATLVPYLTEEIPTVANGGVSEDLTSITWKLKEGLLWSDGSPVTSADLVFTAQYCMDPEGGCAQLAKFDGVDKRGSNRCFDNKSYVRSSKAKPIRPVRWRPVPNHPSCTVC